MYGTGISPALPSAKCVQNNIFPLFNNDFIWMYVAVSIKHTAPLMNTLWLLFPMLYRMWAMSLPELKSNFKLASFETCNQTS